MTNDFSRRLDEFLSQFDEAEQEVILQYALDHVVPRLKGVNPRIAAHLQNRATKCSEHPDAPHGFDRNASHNADRYVCDCESWEMK